MFRSESEGTGINMSESEGTGISMSESEGTGLRFSESEGTGISHNRVMKSKHRSNSFLFSFCLLMLTVSQIAAANNAFLYATEGKTYQGLIVDSEGNSHMVEGIIQNNLFEGFINNTVMNANNKSVDDGTGNKSVDDGTGNKSVDDGTGSKSVDDGTGGYSVDDGTGLLVVQNGSEKLIQINMKCNSEQRFNAQIQFGNTNQLTTINTISMNGNNNTCKF